MVIDSETGLPYTVPAKCAIEKLELIKQRALTPEEFREYIAIATESRDAAEKNSECR
jgi:hypothetical protein